MKARTIVLAAAGVAGALVLHRRFALHEEIDWDDAPRTGDLIDIDGARIHYVDRGHGPAVVLIHGFGGQTYQFRHLIPVLERDHRVIAVDLKGFGYSERVTSGLSHTDQAVMLHRLLGRLGIARATFVGHSMGGGVVQRYAATYPDNVSGLVLAASVAGDESSGRVRPPAWLLRPLLPVLAPVLGGRLLDASFYDPTQVTSEVRDEYRRPERIRGSMDGLLAMFRDAAADGPIDRSRITQPALLLYAADDRVIRIEVAQRLRAALPKARLVVIDRCGHLLFEERPAECAAALREFLREVEPIPVAGV
jgi:pimeloyl-ACP methyl ester carboxylesterase